MPTPQEKLFDDLSKYLKQWFYEPPIEALELALSIYSAHLCTNEKPIWSFFVGPSSVGKTRLILTPLAKLPHITYLDNITENTFLSGYNDMGVLTKLKDAGKKHQIFIFRDFSTFLSLPAERRAQVQSDLRRMFDMEGAFTKDCGTGHLSWEGKITVLAACTPALERHWTVTKDLGERFLSYKLPYIDSVVNQRNRAKMSRKQIGFEKEIDEYIQNKVVEIIGDPKLVPTVDTDIDVIDPNNECDETAILVSMLRRTVIRNSYSGKKEIMEVEPMEGASRLAKSIIQIAVGNAFLFHNAGVSTRGIQLAKKSAMYSVHPYRYKILAALLKDSDCTMNYFDLKDKLKSDITSASFELAIEDLEALDIVKLTYNGSAPQLVELDPEIQETAMRANLDLDVVRYKVPTRGDVSDMKEVENHLLPNNGIRMRKAKQSNFDVSKLIDLE